MSWMAWYVNKAAREHERETRLGMLGIMLDRGRAYAYALHWELVPWAGEPVAWPIPPALDRSTLD